MKIYPKINCFIPNLGDKKTESRISFELLGSSDLVI